VLRDSQTIFDTTGGLHAAGLFSPGGELELLREDVGRHNAVDKLVGHGMMTGTLPFSSSVLIVSGRLSFEIVQKAAVAGIPVIGAVSAPSSLAVATAERFEQTLVGFLRDGRGNIYTHPERIAMEREPVHGVEGVGQDQDTAGDARPRVASSPRPWQQFKPLRRHGGSWGTVGTFGAGGSSWWVWHGCAGVAGFHDGRSPVRTVYDGQPVAVNTIPRWTRSPG
jgi:hypothetical protein